MRSTVRPTSEGDMSKSAAILWTAAHDILPFETFALRASAIRASGAVDWGCFNA